MLGVIRGDLRPARRVCLGKAHALFDLRHPLTGRPLEVGAAIGAIQAVQATRV